MSRRNSWRCRSCGGNIDTIERKQGLCYACDADQDRQRFYEYGNGWKAAETRKGEEDHSQGDLENGPHRDEVGA